MGSWWPRGAVFPPRHARENSTHDGAAADTETIGETVCAAGEAVAELIAVVTPAGEAPVDAAGVSEVGADTGSHSNEVLRELEAMGVRS